MHLPKRTFVDPTRNTVFAVVAVSVSLFVFAYSTRFGKPPILAFYACWLPLLAIEPRILVPGLGRVALLLILPAVATLSALWSDTPGTTLRAGVQYGTTALCGLIAARVIHPRSLAIGGLFGTILVLAYSFHVGRSSYDVVDGTYAFAGAFSSKNQLGLFASLGIMFSVAVLVLFPTRWPVRLLAIGVGGWSALALALSLSVASIITVAGALGVVVVAKLIVTLPPGPRRVAIAACLAAVLIALPLVALTSLQAELLAVFGKDASLTGRTYLWREGVEQGHRHPIVGLGYYAFWTHGRPLAEELWDLFYITARTGFHFHNTLIEAYVGLGLLGVALMLGMIAGLIGLVLRVMMNRRLTGEGIFCAALALMFTVRSGVEIDFFTPYTAGGFLVYYLLLQMSDQRAVETRLSRRGRVPFSARHPMPSCARSAGRDGRQAADGNGPGRAARAPAPGRPPPSPAT